MGLSTILSLDDHVSVVNQVEVSFGIHSSNNVEVSFDVKSELFVELSLGWFLLVLVDVDNSPSLVSLAVLVLNNDVLVLVIETS